MTIKPVKNKSSWASPLAGVLEQTISAYYDQLPLKREKVSAPRGASALEAALIAGTVTLRQGSFRGQFDAAISKELRFIGATYCTDIGVWHMPPALIPPRIAKLAQKTDEVDARWIAKLQSAIAKATPIGIIAAVALPAIYRHLAGKVSSEIERTTGREISLPFDPEAPKVFSMTVEDAVRGFSETETRRIAALIRKAAKDGWGGERLQTALAGRVGMVPDRARFMARQGMAIAATELKAKMYIQAGLPRYRWHTMGDAKVRSDHALLDGHIFEWANPPLVNSATGMHAHPGQDWNCFLPDTPIHFGSGILLRGFCRPYSGKIMRFNLRNGDGIRVTPNHPIFTTRGWVPANEIKKDDKVLKRVQMNAFGIGGAEPNHGYASAKEIFSFLNVPFGAERVSGGDHQFHGDGIVDKKVHVVSTNSFLREGWNSSAHEKICQSIFSDPHMASAFFAALGDKDSLFISMGDASNRVVRCNHLIASLNGTHARPFDFFRFTGASSLNSQIQENSLDGGSADSKMCGNSLFADPRFVKAFDLLGGEMDFVMGLGSFFSHAEISDIGVEEYSGDVFNFETDCGMYMANGVLSSNCRCFAEPLDEGDQK